MTTTIESRKTTVQEPPPPWAVLTQDLEEFQAITRLLVEFDEKTGRYGRFRDPETHYMRKALSTGDPDLLRVFLRHLGGFIYHVVVEYTGPGGLVITAWVHEDGIRTERDRFYSRKSHPVHSIRCLTDLHETCCLLNDRELEGLNLNDYTLNILAGETPEAA